MSQIKNLFILFLLVSQLATAQTDSLLTAIFFGHPRSGDKENESTLSTIEKADYSEFDLILLGGDITYHSSKDRETLEYCDSIFDLDSPNTLWALGNHDTQNISLVLNFTGKYRYYAKTVEGITFVVIDTEINTPHIQGKQLDFLKNIADTIEHSKYLVTIQHRMLWMVGNEEFAESMDSVAWSTRTLDSSNYNSEIIPLYEKVVQKGIPVLCIAGDRTNWIFEHNISDSIHFIANGLRETYDDTQNKVTVLSYNKNTNQLIWEHIPLKDLKLKATYPSYANECSVSWDVRIFPNPVGDNLQIDLNVGRKNAVIEILNCQGKVFLRKQIITPNSFINIPVKMMPSGVYFARIIWRKETQVLPFIKN